MSLSDKPVVILDQHFRKVDELFSADDYEALNTLCHVIGGANRPMAPALIDASLPDASFLVAARPSLTRKALSEAGRLRAIIEVSGTFQEGLDYAYCFERGIEVLSCAPGFRFSVAEMTLGLLLAGARGIVSEHEKFRAGSEGWLVENVGSDFSLYGQSVGFVGFGAIARETARLLAPFGATLKVFDPWLASSGVDIQDATFCGLEETVLSTRCLIIAAVPTDENYHMVDRRLIERMAPGTLVVLVSRSHLVDFEALIEAADDGRIRVATDVFPDEPVPRDASVRHAANIILSPHRAAAVEGGRHPIGRMIVHDIEHILAGTAERSLQPATPERIQNIIRAPRMAAVGGQ